MAPDRAARTSRRLAIVDGFGGAGAAYPRGWAARLRSERWRDADYPQWRPLLRDDPAGERRTAFGHQVRRMCPFVPPLAGRISRDTALDGDPAPRRAARQDRRR